MPKGKVLLAHDHPHSMEAYMMMLIRHGFEIILAVTLAKAQLAFLDNPDIFVAIIDGYMPGEKGEKGSLESTIEFLKVFNHMNHSAKLIAYSLDSTELMEAGCHYLCHGGEIVPTVLKIYEETQAVRSP